MRILPMDVNVPVRGAGALVEKRIIRAIRE